jgi:hypothetical protein
VCVRVAKLEEAGRVGPIERQIALEIPAFRFRGTESAKQVFEHGRKVIGRMRDERAEIAGRAQHEHVDVTKACVNGGQTDSLGRKVAMP